jgi:urease accessory protein
LEGLARYSLGTLDLPILLRLYRCWMAADLAGVKSWTAQLMAARETSELRAEERHLGTALARVLGELDLTEAADWIDGSATFATLFSLAAARWRIGATDALCGYLWAWSENQVLATIKLVPLGQSAGQRLLHELTQIMPSIVARAARLTDAELGVAVITPLLASALHESQYTRLFRS